MALFLARAVGVGEMQDGDVSQHLHHHAPLIPAVTEWHQEHQDVQDPLFSFPGIRTSSHPSQWSCQNCRAGLK